MYEIVCDAVPELPQASVTVQVFVVERLHPVPDSSPTVPAAISPELQLSITVAAPNAAAICTEDGLQESDNGAAREITGTFVSTVYVNV